jgi:ubiquinone/menaquinone biosynthesis C-methylase UbiE
LEDVVINDKVQFLGIRGKSKMNIQFQDMFVSPYDQTELIYKGTYSEEKWQDGLLVSKGRKWNVIDGVPNFDSDKEGDQFSQEDIESWIKGGRFKRRWDDAQNKIQTENEIYHSLCQDVADVNLSFMEIASGPGLGLIPDIISKNSNIKCIATDANSEVISKWSKFFKDNEIDANISFASFDATKMPIRSDSVDVITSYIGLSSLRIAGWDRMAGVNEAFRVLKHGGYLFAIENTWKDRKALHEAFSLWGKKYWFNDEELSWHDKFHKAGFNIIYEKLQKTRFLTSNDNELGEIAEKFGIKIGMDLIAYKLSKI